MWRRRRTARGRKHSWKRATSQSESPLAVGSRQTRGARSRRPGRGCSPRAAPSPGSDDHPPPRRRRCCRLIPRQITDAAACPPGQRGGPKICPQVPQREPRRPPIMRAMTRARRHRAGSAARPSAAPDRGPGRRRVQRGPAAAPALDDYVLDAAGADRPRVLLPADGRRRQLELHRQVLRRLLGAGLRRPATCNAVQPARSTTSGRCCSSQDVIYVGGGNTVNLLAVWRAQGIDRDPARGVGARHRARRAVRGLDVLVRGRRDGVLRHPARRPSTDGLGLLPGSNCPHYNVRRDAYTDALRGGLAPGLAAEDGVALHFVDRRLAAVVASREDRRAYRVGVAGRPRDRGAAAPDPARRRARPPRWPIRAAEARPALAAAL